jgi:hypothetical protein
MNRHWKRNEEFATCRRALLSPSSEGTCAAPYCDPMAAFATLRALHPHRRPRMCGRGPNRGPSRDRPGQGIANGQRPWVSNA